MLRTSSACLVKVGVALAMSLGDPAGALAAGLPGECGDGVWELTGADLYAGPGMDPVFN